MVESDKQWDFGQTTCGTMEPVVFKTPVNWWQFSQSSGFLHRFCDHNECKWVAARINSPQMLSQQVVGSNSMNKSELPGSMKTGVAETNVDTRTAIKSNWQETT
jgi:hypothetical protein